ncbi:MAG: hypothetical protein ACREFC_04430 [Stellaceae bacterium]
MTFGAIAHAGGNGAECGWVAQWQTGNVESQRSVRPFFFAASDPATALSTVRGTVAAYIASATSLLDLVKPDAIQPDGGDRRKDAAAAAPARSTFVAGLRRALRRRR